MMENKKKIKKNWAKSKFPSPPENFNFVETAFPVKESFRWKITNQL